MIQPSLKQRRTLRKMLWISAALCAPALFLVFRALPGFPLNERSEVAVKLVFAVATLLLVLVRSFSSSVLAQRAGNALGLAAFLAVLVYFNLGAAHGRVYVHYWEQFHYSLGAKYFPELGYDGLYAASIEAQRAVYPQEALQHNIRDLRSNSVVLTDAAATRQHRREVRERFSDRRWASFVSDHRHFLDINSRAYLTSIRRDHGFNPPPSWTFTARLFAGWPSLDGDSLAALANLDVLLLALMFVVIFRTYGARIGCLALVIFGVNYAGRFYWVGGAFLREDWLASTVIAICMLHKGKHRLAGAFFGYAAAVRIFPILFLMGPAVLALKALLGKKEKDAPKPRWILDLGVGFAAAIIVALALGSLTGRGPEAWNEFAQAIELHRGTWLTNNVGLENVVLYDRAILQREQVDFSLPEPWVHVQARLETLRDERGMWIMALRFLLLSLVVIAAWRMPLDQSAVLGMVTVFALLSVTCYYWQMLLLVPLLRKTWWLYGALVLNLALYVVHLQTSSFEMRYGLMSWGLLLLFVGGLAPLAWKNWQSLQADRTAS